MARIRLFNHSRDVGRDHQFKTTVAALRPENGHLRQFLISAFAVNTRSPFFMSPGNFSCQLRVLPIESRSPNKTRLTGASKKEGAHHGRRIDWIGGRNSGDGSPPRRAVHLLPSPQVAQRRAARRNCPPRRPALRTHKFSRRSKKKRGSVLTFLEGPVRISFNFEWREHFSALPRQADGPRRPLFRNRYLDP